MLLERKPERSINETMLGEIFKLGLIVFKKVAQVNVVAVEINALATAIVFSDVPNRRKRIVKKSVQIGDELVITPGVSGLYSGLPKLIQFCAMRK